MRKPPVTTTDKPNEQYAFGDKVLYGFPSRTYFELYTGPCSSDKIYSVQTKDFPKDVSAVVYDPTFNLSKDLEKMKKNPAVGHFHVFAEYSKDLSDFLAKAGIDDKDVDIKVTDQNGYIHNGTGAFVNPVAFEWMTEDGVVVEDFNPIKNFVSDPTQAESTSMKHKSLLAAIIAVIALLKHS